MVASSLPTSPTVTCTLVERLDGLEAHGAAWDALAASLPQCLPMLTHAWVATYLERMEVPQGSWLAILAYDGEALVGVLVGVVEGGVLRVPCDYHADDGDVVLAVGREREALSALLAALRAHRPRIRALELGAVREDSPTNVALATGLPGWAQAREPALYGSSFEIHGDPGAWFQSLSKHLRADLRRYLNKLRKAGFDEPTLSFDAGSAAGPERLEDLMRLEASGWKGEAGSAIGMNEGTQTKYRSLARRFAAHGMLEWHELRLGDRLAAMHMCVRMGDDLMLLRHSFEDELGAFGVGNLLLRAAVEREHTRRAHGQINLVTDYAWCRRWRTKLSRYDHVVLARRRSLPFLTRVLPVRIRQLARRTPGAARLARWARSRREAGAGAPASR